MGRDKASLPFGPNETMLQRVVRLVGEVVPAERIVCVAAPGQAIPRLAGPVSVVHDPTPHAGPLAGLATGLAAMQQLADAVFVTACDMPLLLPGFMERMFELLGEHQIAAPHDGDCWQPLAAVYRTGVRPQVDGLLAGGERSVVAVLEACDTRRVPAEELRDVDPNLVSLRACNTRAEYEDALQVAGFAD